MADVEFKNQWRAVKYYQESSTPKVVKWVIKLSGGLIKDEKQASYVLMGFVVVAIIVSLFLFFGGGTAGKPDLKTKADPQNAIKYQQY